VTNPYRLLDTFASLFEGKPYKHRDSSQNDAVCVQLFEDLLSLNKSAKLTERIVSRQWVVNTGNKAHGVKGRRGDGTFGELVPEEPVKVDPSFRVARGIIATVEIGAEAKILNKSMIKQIDRVMKDLREQVKDFRRGTGSNPITVAVVGVNHAAYTSSYEGDRIYKTGTVDQVDASTGKVKHVHHAHPVDEAAEAIKRLNEDVRPHYDELILLRYRATNEAPFAFEWVDLEATRRDYAAVLTKVSREYERRF